MKVLGLSTQITKKRATVYAILLEGGSAAGNPLDVDSVTVLEEFDIPVDEDELATQLGDAGETIAGRARSLQPDRVIVRRADRPMRPSNMEGPRTRLLIEGALTASVQRVVANTVLRSGKDCALAYGISKDELDALGGTIAKPRWTEAASAALSGFAEDHQPA